MQENLPEYPIRVYNTLTKVKEPFRTIEPGKVGMYLCGPTVYAEAHIGHMVGPVIFDTVKRYLTHCGYEVTWVVNSKAKVGVRPVANALRATLPFGSRPRLANRVGRALGAKGVRVGTLSARR